jgi:hypothetical protein
MPGLAGCSKPTSPSSGDGGTPACSPTAPCPPAKCDATVSIGRVQRGNPYVPKNANPADGMPDSVPPSKTYEVDVTIANWTGACAGKHIDLSIANTSSDTGTATVSPSSLSGDGTFKVTVAGGAQTKSGHGGQLKIQAKLDGTVKAESPGFTVCAHPINYRDTFNSDVDGPAVGVRVNDDWDSDSGTFTDLKEAETSEIVGEGKSDSPPFPPKGSGTGVNSGYMPADSKTVDSHTIGRPPAGPAGTRVFTQLQIFKCHRCGATDKNQPNSGFNIIHEVFKVGSKWKHKTRKVGAAATIGAFSSQAGTASVTSPDHDLP